MPWRIRWILQPGKVREDRAGGAGTQDRRASPLCGAPVDSYFRTPPDGKHLKSTKDEIEP